MPSSVVVAQIGGCGIRTGATFWRQIAAEHGLHPSGLYNGNSDDELTLIEVYFQENFSSSFQPRVLSIDAVAADLDLMRSNSFGDMFSADDMQFFNKSNEGDVYEAIAQFNEMGRVTNRLRLLVENCDSVQGFQLFHALTSGTGAGMGAAFVEKCNDIFPNTLIQSFSNITEPKEMKNLGDEVSDPTFELGLSSILDGTDSAVVFDDKAMEKVMYMNLGLEIPTFADYNACIANAVSTITASFRFPLCDVSNMKKLISNMCPTQNLNLHTISFAPTSDVIGNKFDRRSSESIAAAVLDPLHSFCPNDSAKREQLYISGYLALRGNFSHKHVEKAMEDFKRRERYKSWVENPIIVQHLERALTNGPPKCAALLLNSTLPMTNIAGRCSPKENMKKATKHGRDYMAIKEMLRCYQDFVMDSKKGYEN